MTSVQVPTQDLVPSVTSRVVTIDVTDMQEGAPAEGWIDFILPCDLHVAADDKIIKAGAVRVTLDQGKGQVRLPTYDPDAKREDGSDDWGIIVRKSWTSGTCKWHRGGCGCAGGYLVRVPVGTSAISLADLAPVRPLRGREKQYAITGVSIDVKTGTEAGRASATGAVRGGILDIDLVLPPAGPHSHDDRYYTEYEVDSRIRDSRWARFLNLDGSVPVETLESGLYPVANGSVAAALGLPTAQPGSLWVHRLGPDIGRMEWRPTRTTEVWGRRKHGAAWQGWEIQGVRASNLTADDVVENLPTGLYQVASISVAAALGLPTGDSGSLWVHRLTPETGRMEWRPTTTLDVWQRRLHGSGGWEAWARPGAPTPDSTYTATTPTPAGIAALDGAQLTIETTAHTMIPRSVGPDGQLYGYSTTGTQMLRSGDGLATAPEAVAVHTWVPSELQGAGLAHVEATTSGYMFVYRTTAMKSSVWFSESWAGPYRQVLDMGPWHVTAYARPRVVHGTTWMMLGEYTNSTIPSTPDRRWLTIDGGKTWRLIRTTTPITDQTNNHCHTGLIASDGRLYISNGDGINNSFEYSDDLGATWKPIPTSERIRGQYTRTHQPTLLIDWGDRITTSPDAGPYQPGLWEMDPVTLAQDYKWEAPGGPYVDASKRYGRSIYAQSGDAAFVLFPPGASPAAGVEPRTYVAGTPDRGRTWGVVATIDATGGNLSDGIVGPDRNGYLFMRGIGIPTYGGNVIRAKQPDWN